MSQTVVMNTSQMKEWEEFSATLQRISTKHLDLCKVSFQDMTEAEVDAFWSDCVKGLSKVNSLVKMDLARCTPTALQEIFRVCPQLQCFTATKIKNGSVVNLINIGSNLTELKLKALGSMKLSNWQYLKNLTKLKQLSLKSVTNVNSVLLVIRKMIELEDLELGDFTNISEASVVKGFSNLSKLKRLRLERGQHYPVDKMMETISKLPSLVQLELINFDVEGKFDESLGLISNIKILLIIPIYGGQTSMTNHLVINGIKQLAPTLKHFIWGLTLEMLKGTDRFIEYKMEKRKHIEPKEPMQTPRNTIPILNPDKSSDIKKRNLVQVNMLELPKLHMLLSTMLPTTKIIFLKVPFNATWRQTLSSTLQLVSGQ